MLTLDENWALDPSVAIRPEPFGALAYHFGNRRLVFLKRPDLVAVVQGLGDGTPVRHALAEAGVPEADWTEYLAALQGLARSGLIRPIGRAIGEAAG